MNHSEDKTESFYIRCFIQSVNEKLNWPVDKTMINRDYEFLSREIEKVTTTRISDTTLKRIWGGNYKNLPQVQTLLAFARFIGYDDWEAFKQSIEVPKEGNPFFDQVYSNMKKKKVWLWLLMILPLFILFLFWINQKSDKFKGTRQVKMSPKKEHYHGIPVTVGFNFDISQIEDDNDCFIQLSWNRLERTKVTKANNFISAVYYYPGYHQAKLFIDDSAMIFRPIYITTDDWVVSIKSESNSPIPKYLTNEHTRKEGWLVADSAAIVSQGLLPPSSDIYSSFYFSNEVLNKLNGDNFTLKSRIKNSQFNKATLCLESAILIYGEFGNIIVHFPSKGCEGNALVVHAAEGVDGELNDLANLAIPMDTVTNITLSTNDNQLIIQIDKEEVFKLPFQHSIGEIKALQYLFTGLGEIDEVGFYDAHDSIRYQQTF